MTGGSDLLTRLLDQSSLVWFKAIDREECPAFLSIAQATFEGMQCLKYGEIPILATISAINWLVF